MAAFLYDECRRSIGGIPTHSVIDFNDDTLKAYFIDHGTDTPSQTADQDAGDRTGAFPAYASAVDIQNSTSISSSVMVLDGVDTVFTALDTSATTVESYDIFKESGSQATSPMVSNHDDYTGLPFTGTGGDVTVVYAATGIIRI